jgi:hypothetical protein
VYCLLGGPDWNRVLVIRGCLLATCGGKNPRGTSDWRGGGHQCWPQYWSTQILCCWQDSSPVLTWCGSDASEYFLSAWRPVRVQMLVRPKLILYMSAWHWFTIWNWRNKGKSQWRQHKSDEGASAWRRCNKHRQKKQSLENPILLDKDLAIASHLTQVSKSCRLGLQIRCVFYNLTNISHWKSMIHHSLQSSLR